VHFSTFALLPAAPWLVSLHAVVLELQASLRSRPQHRHVLDGHHGQPYIRNVAAPSPAIYGLFRFQAALAGARPFHSPLAHSFFCSFTTLMHSAGGELVRVLLRLVHSPPVLQVRGSKASASLSLQ